MPHANTPAIEFRDVWKTYGSREVLKGLSLQIPASQKVAIIGPSGSGKTTILRLLMGLEPVTRGKILIDGATSDPEHAYERDSPLRKIGMVFQHFNLFPHKSALDNIALAPQRVLKRTPTQARERAADLLAQVGLADRATNRPDQLSGGEKQRVGIARALAMDPEIVLFDEVTSALDPERVGEVLQVMRRLARDTEMTMLFVTHEMTFARHVADRVIFMENGAIVEEGPPDKIFTNPQSPRCRAFLRAVLDPLGWADPIEPQREPGAELH